MKQTWEIAQDVHVDLGDGDRRVVRDFVAGTVSHPLDADDLLVLSHLQEAGLANIVSGAGPKKKTEAKKAEEPETKETAPAADAVPDKEVHDAAE